MKNLEMCCHFNFSQCLKMRFVSTRSTKDPSQKTFTFEDAVLSGYAPNGGMIMPDVNNLPQLTPAMLQEFASLSYPQLVARVLGLFIDEAEIPHDEMEKMITKALHANFSHPDILPIVEVGKENVRVLEMFHGATGSFKDLALSVLGAFLSYFLEKRNKNAIVLVGTSGDTGSAAINAIKVSPRLSIVVLFPRGRISALQEAQMTTHPETNVRVFSVDGSSDDLDVPIKAVLNDTHFCAEKNICTINSINLCRILVQIVHYIYGYIHATQKSPSLVKEGQQVTFAVPTGAAGNIAAGLLAVKMGLPIKIIACVNDNDIIHNVLSTGEFRASSEVQVTLSPAIDILVPYNWERILYLISDDGPRVGELMRQFDREKGFTVPQEWLSKIRLHISSSKITQTETKWAMRALYEQSGYVIDPHTAVATAEILRLERFVSTFYFVLSTASAAKFSTLVREIMGPDVKFPIPKSFAALEEGMRTKTLKTFEKKMDLGTDWEAILRNEIRDLCRTSPCNIK